MDRLPEQLLYVPKYRDYKQNRNTREKTLKM